MIGILQRTARLAKRMIARTVANGVTGAVVSVVLRDRILTHGVILNTQSPLIGNAVKARMLFGMYESAERRLVVRHLRHDLPVVELGASIGYISALIGRHGVPRHIAVEANPLLLPLIERSLETNGIANARIVHAAIDYSGGATVRLHFGSDNTEAAVVADKNCAKDDASVTVPAMTLGMILESVAIDDFVLVCDIEGSELGMIAREADSVIARCQQMIIELHDCSRDSQSPMSTVAMAGTIQSRWGMREIYRDGNVWLFERVKESAL